MLMSKLKNWRIRIFASTWLCYAGLYFCRKPFYIAKASLGSELHFSADMLGSIGAVYLIAYTIGQFVAGAAGDHTGPRILLLSGMAISLICNFVFGLVNSPAQFLIFMALNGLAQATGWSGTVGTMANWFHRGERGTVMGFWSTNFQIGGVVANGLAAWALGAYGFRYSFFFGSVVLMSVWVFFFFNQRNRPEDLGLSAVQDPQEIEGTSKKVVRKEEVKWSRSTIINILLIGTFYFFIKFIRYALWSWAPFFLSMNFHMVGSSAGYLSTLFDLFGIGGVIITGVLSDRLFKSRRAGVSLLMILVMVAACIVMYTAGGSSIFMFGVSISLIGFTLYGPDALLSGAGAMDAGSRRGATLAAGIINGMGSIGSVVQETVIGKLYDHTGGALGPIFLILLGSAGAAAVVLGIIQMRNHLKYSDV